jgi:hypothetical protein
MKKITLLFLLIPTLLFAQDSPRKMRKKIKDLQLVVIDSLIASPDEVANIDPNTIATVRLLTDTDATKLYGEDAKGGVLICETKPYARKKYIKFFRKVSHQYDSLYSTTNSDSTFQYILNKKIKTENFEGTLSLINDDLFISLEIVTADDLKNKYGITGKSYGILIYSKKPADLYDKKGEF